MNPKILPSLLVFSAVSTAFGQTAIFQQDLTNTSDDVSPEVGEWRKSTAPYFFEEEIEDVGPQYLLSAAQKRTVFRFSGDFQTYFTSNANLTNNGAVNSSISVGTIQPEFLPFETNIDEGLVSTRVGVRFQWYRYGIYGNQDKQVFPNYPVSNNDFDSISPYAEANYRNGGWYGAIGFEYTQLENQFADRIFYKESAPYWAGGYTLEVTPQSAFYFQYDGRYRFTKTTPGATPIPFIGDLNNRVDQAFSIIYSHIFFEDLLVQGSYRFQWTGYTDGSRLQGNRNRDDIYNTVSAVVSYWVFDEVAVRVFVNWQDRNTDDRFAQDYQVFNGGGGVNISMNF